MPFKSWTYKAGLDDLPDSDDCAKGFEETAEQTIYYCCAIRPVGYFVRELMDRIALDQILPLDDAYVCLPHHLDEMNGVSLSASCGYNGRIEDAFERNPCE